MRLKKFEHLTPTTLSEACLLLQESGTAASLIAGGTDLLVRMKYGVTRPERLVNLKKVHGLDFIETAGEELRIGAVATLSRIRRSQLVQERYPVLAEAALAVGAAQLQNMGTIGGNICLQPRCWYFQQGTSWRQGREDCLKNGGGVCHMAKGSKRCYALYCGDTSAALLALGARVRLVSARGERVVPLETFFIDDGINHVDLGPGELLAEVILPAPVPKQQGTYLKYRKRGAVDFPIVGVAAVLSDAPDPAYRIRIGITGVGSAPLLVVPEGCRLDKEGIEEVAEQAAKRCRTVSKMEVSPAYRKELVRVLVKDALAKLV